MQKTCHIWQPYSLRPKCLTSKPALSDTIFTCWVYLTYLYLLKLRLILHLNVALVGLSIQPDEEGTGLLVSCGVETGGVSKWELKLSIWKGEFIK